MTTPVYPVLPNPVLYASVTDLINVLAGTDGGTGTPATLSQAQLILALTSASNRVSVYFGSIQDDSNASATPPSIFHDLTLDLAAFFAWRTYLKGKAIPSDHPAYLAYQNAQQMLNDARDGVLRLDPAAAGGVNSEIGEVINLIPRIFTHQDSNTRIDPLTGALTSDDPFGWSPHAAGLGLDNGGATYQG